MIKTSKYKIIPEKISVEMYTDDKESKKTRMVIEQGKDKFVVKLEPMAIRYLHEVSNDLMEILTKGEVVDGYRIDE